MKYFHPLIGLIALLLTHGAFAATNVPCDVTGYGNFPGGESFSGSAQDWGVTKPLTGSTAHRV
jgi:hypothetical protein